MYKGDKVRNVLWWSILDNYWNFKGRNRRSTKTRSTVWYTWLREYRVDIHDLIEPGSDFERLQAISGVIIQEIGRGVLIRRNNRADAWDNGLESRGGGLPLKPLQVRRERGVGSVLQHPEALYGVRSRGIERRVVRQLSRRGQRGADLQCSSNR